MKPIFRRSLTCAFILAAHGLCLNAAYAGAFQLAREYNAVELGNSGAGGAAIAQDASTAYANPAGLVRIPNKQLMISGDAIFTHSKFSGANTWRSTTAPAGPSYTQSGTVSTNDKMLVPSFAFAMPLAQYGLPKWNTALSVTVPYGLSTNYGNSSLIRYSATSSKLSVIDISPDLAYKFNDQWSLGAGLDIERVGVSIRRVVGAPILSPSNPTLRDSTSKNSADGWGYGGHAGVLFQLTPKSRVGLAYHTSVKVGVTGNSVMTGRLAGSSGSMSLDTLRATFILPSVTVLSGHHEFNNPWSIDASAYYTQWTTLSGTLTAYNLAGTPPVTPTTTSIPQHYRNTWLLALGGGYQLTRDWLIRAGMSYDQSPVKSAERNVLIPDADRVGLSVGAHYQVNKQVGLDAGWMHLFFHDSSVSIPLAVGSQSSTSIGSYNDSHVDLLGLQATIDFV